MPESSEDRILYMLKSRGALTAADIAGRLGMSDVGARKHLMALQAQGLVVAEDRRQEVGRPKRYWSLGAKGHARFPDTHSDLTLELLTSVRRVFGAGGLEKLISDRERRTEADYAKALEDCSTLAERIGALAAIRDREGYMAEWLEQDDGAFLLSENHCPICAAARECQGLCRSELSIFQSVLGPAAHVERIEHVLTGARRCAYRISAVE